MYQYFNYDLVTMVQKLAYAKSQYDNDLIRVTEQEKLYYYYIGDKIAIEIYLAARIANAFGTEILEDNEWVFDWQNLTKKLIDQLAVVYREPAKRFVLKEDGTVDEDLTKYFNDLLTETVNSKDKKAHRFAKLLNTSLTQITFDRDCGKINFLIDGSHKYEVETDDDNPYKLTKVTYKKYYKNKEKEDELFTVVWTDEEHYLKNADDKEIPVGDNEDTTNPFGIIPFAKLMMQEGEDIWGEGQSDVVNTNEIINLLLTTLTNDHIINGGAGLLITTNLGLNTKKDTTKRYDGKEITEKVRTGRRHPFNAEDVRNDMQKPSAEYVTTNPLITEIQGNIDYRIKQIALLKGLNPNSFLQDVQATSGYSKIIDSLEQLEIRRDDIEPCRIYEKEKYEIIKKVNNAAYADAELRTKFNLKEIPATAKIKIDFAEIQVEQTTTDLWLDRQNKFNYNMQSPLDWLKEENPDLSDEDAQNILDKNSQIKKGLQTNPQTSTFDMLKAKILQPTNNNN